MGPSLPTRPGFSLSEMSTTDGGQNVLVMYEMTGEADGDAWIAASADSLVTDPDRNRSL